MRKGSGGVCYTQRNYGTDAQGVLLADRPVSLAWCPVLGARGGHGVLCPVLDRPIICIAIVAARPAVRDGGRARRDLYDTGTGLGRCDSGGDPGSPPAAEPLPGRCADDLRERAPHGDRLGGPVPPHATLPHHHLASPRGTERVLLVFFEQFSAFLLRVRRLDRFRGRWPLSAGERDPLWADRETLGVRGGDPALLADPIFGDGAVGVDGDLCGLVWHAGAGTSLVASFEYRVWDRVRESSFREGLDQFVQPDEGPVLVVWDRLGGRLPVTLVFSIGTGLPVCGRGRGGADGAVAFSLREGIFCF